MGDFAGVAENLLAGEVEKPLHLSEPAGHGHNLPIQRTQFGVVDEHGDKAVQLGDLRLVQVIPGNRDIALQHLANEGLSGSTTKRPAMQPGSALFPRAKWARW